MNEPVGTLTVLTGTDVVKTGLDPTIPNHKQCLDRLELLTTALLARDPMMPKHLAEIHKQLIAEEELVHLLSEEEIGRIMAAQQVYSNTVLTQAVTTKSGKAAAVKAGAKLTLSDL